MVHVPTCTTIYIIVIGDTDEARTIMRAEPVAVYTALDKFATHEWMEICTDTLSSLYTILHYYRKLETRGPQYYHHHLLLLSRIADLLEKRRRQGFITSLHKFWAHANIRGNDLADATTKMAVTQYDFLPESQKLKVYVGEKTPRPSHWVMYTVRPPPFPKHMGTCIRVARLGHPWWSIPEGERCRCTLSRATCSNTYTKSDMRSYVASTTLPYIAV
jgi:hypothetical protein